LIDQLLRPAVGNGQLAARLKISVIGVMGHSLGGEVSLAALQRDSRLKAAVALDPPIGPEDLAGVSRAVLIMTAGRRKWSAQECHLWQNLRGPRLLINLTSADHFTFSDALWMFGSSSVLTDDPQAKKAIAFLRYSIGRFFDQHLKEGTASAWHQAAHPQPGIAITTQYETLCAVPRANVQGGVQ
jgi:pimeloyl-ACP methyl ester carboxylesterase